MRYVTLLAVAGLILTVTATAGAVTIVFDPNDILDLYPVDSSGLKATQADARRVHHEKWGNTIYNTFSDAMATGHTQPEDYNTYMNWRDSLNSEGEGIACFNSWFLNNPAAASWGETVVTKPGTGAIGTAVDGWNVAYIDNPYNLGGTSVQWYTLDSTKRLRPTDLGGADIGEFSITIDLYWDSGTKGWDPGDVPVQLGEEVRFWLGGLNGDDPGFYRSDTQSLYYDANGWGSRTTYTGFTPSGAYYSTGSRDYGSGFEVAMSATAVPEPMTMLAVGMGIAGLAGYIRKRKMA